MLTLTFVPGERLYTQIHRAVVLAIQDGTYASGAKLPSRRTLADHLGVSVNTVRLAYDQLVDEGYVVARPRSGYVVDKLSRERLCPVATTRIAPVAPVITPRYDARAERVVTPKRLTALWRQAFRDGAPEAPGGWSPAGLWPLREAVAHYLKGRRGVVVSPERIAITGDVRDQMATLSAVLPDAVVAVERPGYAAVAHLASWWRRTLIDVPLDRYGVSVADLETTEANVVIVTPNHQCPTGLIMGIRRSQRLLDWAGQAPDRYVIEDDYDSDLKYARRPIPALKSLDGQDRVILAGRFDPVLGPHVGLGYIVWPQALVDRYAAVTQGLGAVSPLAQRALVSVMQSGAFDRHVNRLTTACRRTRERVVRALMAYDGVRVLGAEAGLFVVVRIDPVRRRIVTSQNGVIVDDTLAFRTLEAYGGEGESKDDIVLGFGALSDDTIDKAIAELMARVWRPIDGMVSSATRRAHDKDTDEA